MPVCDNPDFAGSFENGEDARTFMLAGNATVTFVSKRTGTRYTFQLKAPWVRDEGRFDYDANVRFVGALIGPDNEADFVNVGTIFVDRMDYRTNRKRPDTAQSRAFEWAWARIAVRTLPEHMEIWHDGRCGRCHRKLTVPESVRQGFGPECINKV